MAEEIERDCVELGDEGRLIRMQLQELIADVPTEKISTVLDYQSKGAEREAQQVILGLASLPYESLLDFQIIAELLGYSANVDPMDYSVSPRGYRILSHVPRLSDQMIRRVVEGMPGLEAIVRASQRELEAVEGVSPARAREIREGLRRLQEHNLVDRYLQL
jgi:diadenylate cyclase